MVQETPGLIPELFGARPVLLIPVALSIALFEGERPSMMFGLFSGLLIDFGIGGALGFHALLLAATCFFFKRACHRFNPHKFFNSHAHYHCRFLRCSSAAMAVLFRIRRLRGRVLRADRAFHPTLRLHGSARAGHLLFQPRACFSNSRGGRLILRRCSFGLDQKKFPLLFLRVSRIRDSGRLWTAPCAMADCSGCLLFGKGQ